MPTLTIQTVDPATRTWEGPKGTIEFIQGQFTDGTGWSLGAKPENAAKRVEELTKLIGVEGEYEVEPKGEFRGKPQFKLKSWPGKPVFGGGGGNKAPRDETGMAIGAAGHDAAVLVAALIAKGEVTGWDNVLGVYNAAVERIYDHNKWLRASTTPPGVDGAAGAGTPSGPVPTTSAADEGREKTSGSKGTGAAADRDWGAAGGEASAPCSHGDTVDFKPDGSPLPNPFIRCVDCGKVMKA